MVINESYEPDDPAIASIGREKDSQVESRIRQESLSSVSSLVCSIHGHKVAGV